jgi:hypothetical protein
MEGLSFVTPVTGFNRPIIGKEDDNDDCIKLWQILLVGGGGYVSLFSVQNNFAV